MCFHVLSGVFTYLSYRDPNLVKTLDNYDGTVQFLRDIEMDDDALTKAIIGTIGDVDSYQLPDAKGYSRYAFSSHFKVFKVYTIHRVSNAMYQDLNLVLFPCSMMRYIMGITDEERQKRRDEILSTR